MTIKDVTDMAVLKTTRFCKVHANGILTVVSIVGLGTSMYFAAKGALEAEKRIRAEEEARGVELTKKEKFMEAAPEYIPSIISASITIASIIVNHRINQAQKIALCGAYAMVGSSYEKYKKTVKDVCGEEKAKEVDVAMAEDIYINQYGGVFGFQDDLQDIGHSVADECIFFDPISELYFHKTPEDVRLAEYHLNRNLALRGDVSLWEFYQFLGIENYVCDSRKHTRDTLQSLGWDCGFLLEEYETSWIDFDHELVEMSDDRDMPSGFYIIQPVIQPRILDDYEYLYKY